MDINKLYTGKYPFYKTDGESCEDAKKEAFMRGYKAATTWYPMEEAPKDIEIGIIDKVRGFVVCDWGDPSGGWYLKGSLSTADEPVAWTHLPIYNP